MHEYSDENSSVMSDLEERFERLEESADFEDDKSNKNALELERRIIQEELDKILKSTPRQCETLFARFDCDVQLKSPPKNFANEEIYDSSCNKPKFPFLKRGTGLARFHMSTNDFQKPPTIYQHLKTRPHPKSLKPNKNKNSIRLPKTPIRKLILKPQDDPKIIEDFNENLGNTSTPFKVSRKLNYDEQPVKPVTEKDIAIKIRQKALQDNVKRILDCNIKKNTPRKLVKKFKIKKPRLKPVEKPKICDLLRKLKELEDEKETFRKENIKLKKIQKELCDEKIRLDKERKESEKALQQKWEELNAAREKLTEDQKKLQKDKLVFEKYSRQVKNQPSKQEREEINALKDEINKLKNNINLKETRFGSTQARLRNTLKLAESENARLKKEIDELKSKLSGKRVSFEPKVFNTKILNAINTELDKKIKGSFRRSKSAGNLKENKKIDYIDHAVLEKVESVVETNTEEEKAHRTESEDSGIVSGGPSPDLMENDDNVIEAKDNKIVMNSNSSGENCPNSTTYNAILQLKERVGKLISNTAFNEHFDKPQNQRNSLEEDAQVKERVLPSGEHEIIFPCGKRRVVSSTGDVIRTYFPNGDVSEMHLHTNCDKYFYHQSRIWQTTFRDRPGFQIVETPDGRSVRYMPDGSVETEFLNGSVVRKDKSGMEEWRFKTGEIVRTEPNGDKILIFPSGRREITTNGYTRLEEPNGIIKMLYPDGRQETRFPTGRIRVKDKNGCLLMDTGGFP